MFFFLYSAFCRSALALIQYDSKQNCVQNMLDKVTACYAEENLANPALFLVVHMIYFFGCRTAEQKF